MGCKQSTLRPSAPVVAPSPAAPQQQQEVVVVAAASPVRCVSEKRTEAAASPVHTAAAAPCVDDMLAQILVEPTATVGSPRVESKAASPARLGERAPSVLNVAVAASPKKDDATAQPVVSFSDFLAQQENATSKKTEEKQPRKVVFDAETMRKSAPKSTTTATTKLTKKQQEIVKKNHVSAGRRGPVASRFEKGSRSQMQTDVYLQMANAFERLLTNADTINAHLDTR